MTHFDFSPLYKGAIGFDKLQDIAEKAFSAAKQATGYPPYNIKKTDDLAYTIDVAVAGFKPEDIKMEVKEGCLIVSGETKDNEDGATYLYKGIAGRAFEQKFQLAENIHVRDAFIENGMLSVKLEQEIPEALKPRTIEIKTKK